MPLSNVAHEHILSPGTTLQAGTFEQTSSYLQLADGIF